MKEFVKAAYKAEIEKLKTFIGKQRAEKDGINEKFNYKGKQGYTALHFAVNNGFEQTVKWLLDQQGIDINCVNDEGQTPLCLAAKNGNFGLINLLLERGAKTLTFLNKERARNPLVDVQIASNAHTITARVYSRLLDLLKPIVTKESEEYLQKSLKSLNKPPFDSIELTPNGYMNFVSRENINANKVIGSNRTQEKFIGGPVLLSIYGAGSIKKSIAQVSKILSDIPKDVDQTDPYETYFDSNSSTRFKYLNGKLGLPFIAAMDKAHHTDAILPLYTFDAARTALRTVYFDFQLKKPAKILNKGDEHYLLVIPDISGENSEATSVGYKK